MTAEVVVDRITLIRWPLLPQVITVVTDIGATQSLLKGMDQPLRISS